MKNIEIDTQELEAIISELDKKIISVSDTMNEINNGMNKIDGSYDTWKGNSQAAVYKSYLTIANKFPVIINRLREYSQFLKDTVTNYNTMEKSIENEIDNKEESLDIN